ncbi:MAG TPA: RsmE family RNA methyltransferase [Bryobacteraceae bacterium]|jgi:16S rRNA (uracil1498-N3)-methyltransferase|nr:RsmE family RNA methyltransferase [Bryobacteraceae bacterium]
MARRLFFVDTVRGGHAWITGEDAHHLTKVLRVAPGQKYEISDNRNLYLAEVETARREEVSFAIVDKLAPPDPPAHTELFAALIRFERFEWILEKATELGVQAVHPFVAERSEKGLEAAARKRLKRWRRIAREASEQSRRVTQPEIHEPVDGPPYGVSADLRLMLDESTDAPAILDAIPGERNPRGQVSLCVGPEGGWTPRERTGMQEAGWVPSSLGKQILRAETAAIAALAIVNAAWRARAVP